MKQLARGDFVRLTFGKSSIDAMVMIVSPNGRSVMFGFDGSLRTPSGGAVFGSLPALMDEAGVYRDLVENAVVHIEARTRQ